MQASKPDVLENGDAGTCQQTPAVRVDRLRRDFGALAAVNGVSVTVAPGERRAIIGPNGAGKTTLFNLISGELPPTSGQVYLNGQDVTRWPVHDRVRRGLSRTYQRNNLFQSLTVFENIRLAVQRYLGIGHALWKPANRFGAANERTNSLLAQMGLSERADALAKNLSYGEQRQLEIAIALATEPNVLLLDEPTAGMSPAETSAIARLLQELPRSLTLLVIEHDMDVVFRLAERVTVLHYGEVLVDGSADKVRVDERVLRVYLGAQVPSR
jgi:branched-chain amino acid transport system ATP-binding protein